MAEPSTVAKAQSLYPTAKAELDIGGLSNSQDVVATVEMTPIHEITATPTIAVITTIVQPIYSNPQASRGTTPMYLQEKLGSKFCGCFCDYRRAVIVINSVFIGISMFVVSSQIKDNYYYDDDQIVEEVSTLVTDYCTKRSIVLGVAMLTALLAQVGAVHFNVWLIGLHAVYIVAGYVCFVILSIQLYHDLVETHDSISEETFYPIVGIVFNGLLTCIIIYPHLGLIKEIKSGIMTFETYPREEFSCCCVQY